MMLVSCYFYIYIKYVRFTYVNNVHMYHIKVSITFLLALNIKISSCDIFLLNVFFLLVFPQEPWNPIPFFEFLFVETALKACYACFLKCFIGN